MSKLDEHDKTLCTGASATSDMQPVSVETLKQAMRELEMLPKNDQWLVVDPQGRMYRGTVEQVMPVLVNQHPLMRMPSPFDWRGS